MADAAGRTNAEEVGVLIKEAQALLNQRMGEALHGLGLTVPQYACLQALADTPGITGAELARRAFVSRQSMNVLLQGLERRGLVERSGEPGPRRERATLLAPGARALVHRARSAVVAIVDAMVTPLGDNGAAQFRTLLEACRDVLRDGRA